ncbi:ABC transporter substrate-binding protein [Leptolyngbya sp. AN03gr2]|uniref:ABC transporter substrate-binding protein n=1 Tax=unclassified Leptolyngbya TaxID=2650499 RepID=UPI003D3203B9
MFLKTCRSTIAFFSKYISWALLTAILITACQGGSPQISRLESQPSADCRIVEHAAGKTEICGTPQKIAVLEPKLLSLMLALDVQPAAYADAYLVRSRQFDNPSYQIPYLGKFVTSQPMNLGDRSSPSLEVLILLKPDLILGLKGQEHPVFSSLAPTILIDNEKNWRDNLKTVAQALGYPKDVSSVITSRQQQLDRVRAQLAPLVKTHPKVLSIACSLTMDYIEVIHDGDAVTLLENLGFQPVSLGDVERKLGTRLQLNLETLAQLDADIVIVNTWLNTWDGRSTYQVPLEELKQKWAKTPLLRNSSAWKEGRVYFVDYTLWASVIGEPIASSLILEELPQLLLSHSLKP